MTLKDQLQGVLRSRKFWALILSWLASGVAYSYGKIDAQTAIIAAVTAGSAYMVGTGLEGPGVPILPSQLPPADPAPTNSTGLDGPSLPKA